MNLNRTITFTMNGKKKEIAVDVRQSLLEVLREQLGMISVKQGCAVGECGACTVLIDDVPIDACLYLAVWADGRSIRTVEGESKNGELSKVQQAFVNEGAVQCGICTPGFVMAATAFVEKRKGRKAPRHEIRRGLAAGVDCFEHTGLATAPEYPQDVMEMLRERTAQMNKGPLFWTPTIAVLSNYEYVRDWREMLDDPSWKVGLPDEIVDDIARSFEHPDRLPYFQLTPSRRPTLARKFQQLRDAGVTMLIGTDSGVPLTFHSQSTWTELDVWVNQLGVAPMEAIRSATYWPSVMMGVSDQVGTVTAGKYADIIAVRCDVLRHIVLLQDVDLVIKHGERYK